MRKSEFEIHPFNEAFYIQALLTKTSSILNDVESLNFIWENADYVDQNDEEILNIFQNIIINVAGISRFFWPAKNSGFYKARGERLREIYLVNDLNVLKNRDMRNLIEHFDENLDDFLNEFNTGRVMLNYTGLSTHIDDTTIFFRAFFYDKFIFKILNVEYKIEPIIEEINRIHEILLRQQEKGDRFTLE
ncbi:hypothetical protein [Flavobacterium sharifuzzamanii]|uniref:hypothetical protein n=1 Tax=Flavobacterium sharifuzzamanii TaxID=2211133 RepID=UPI0013006423|nr:hypothetical protein [Flavobacterium sharifuzzamanii]KAF2078894.1 hypothetical protein DMA14_20615 [Flavobacterium sharifuzzamanii]